MRRNSAVHCVASNRSIPSCLLFDQGKKSASRIIDLGGKSKQILCRKCTGGGGDQRLVARVWRRNGQLAAIAVRRNSFLINELQHKSLVGPIFETTLYFSSSPIK